jgi:hypothetical protein
VGAVGRGPVEVDFVEVEVEFELLVELPVLLPLEVGALEVRVEVMGMAAEKATVWRFWSRETPVENEVKTVTGAADAAEDALLF